jgi:hypothetical protein
MNQIHIRITGPNSSEIRIGPAEDPRETQLLVESQGSPHVFHREGHSADRRY